MKIKTTKKILQKLSLVSQSKTEEKLENWPSRTKRMKFEGKKAIDDKFKSRFK